MINYCKICGIKLGEDLTIDKCLSDWRTEEYEIRERQTQTKEKVNE